MENLINNIKTKQDYIRIRTIQTKREEHYINKDMKKIKILRVKLPRGCFQIIFCGDILYMEAIGI